MRLNKLNLLFLSVLVLCSCQTKQDKPLFIDLDTPIFKACTYGDYNAVKKLLESGVDPSIRSDTIHATPMHEAAERGHFEIIKLLHDNGGNINAVDDWGFTPLHNAAGGGHLLIVKYLINNGVDINPKTKSYRQTPLHEASIWGHLDVVKILLESGADVNEIDNNGKNALDLAIEYNYISSKKDRQEVIKLLKNYTKPNHIDSPNGGTP